jgi:POT family proton-dependent oligopeptide transporter
MRVETTKSGERVIVDPAVTTSRLYMYFYLFINIGALGKHRLASISARPNVVLVGQIGMSYSERNVGFWLAFFLPTLLFLLCPLVLYFCRNRYARTPPQGSVFSKAFRLFFKANRGRWSINPYSTWKRLNDGTFWENVKPSKFSAASRPAWMTFDDNWVEEVRRGFHACSVFLWYPLYWIAYNQLNNNLTSQAAVMTLNGIPNDVLSNLDPFALIILIPVCDLWIYPLLRRLHINFTPIKRITWGKASSNSGPKHCVLTTCQDSTPELPPWSGQL